MNNLTKDVRTQSSPLLMMFEEIKYLFFFWQWIIKDGSCNGLQHYAAIGRDLLGAAAVNLVPAEKPQDVYSEIATIVERKRREDAEQGVEIAQVNLGII